MLYLERYLNSNFKFEYLVEKVLIYLNFKTSSLHSASRIFSLVNDPDFNKCSVKNIFYVVIQVIVIHII